MCGILGILAPKPSRSELEQINELLAHRGPDDSGIYIGENVGLAARRLSIIDIEGGHQPMCNEDGTIWLVCNGEIYNSPALRTDLEVEGHRFSTRTDIETIIHGYEQWGEQIVGRLQGMYAFALWDSHMRRLLLARDRFGIKPLYYAQAGQKFAFSSEITPIFKALPELARQANLDALWHLFDIGFIPTPLTAFSDVWEVPPAHTLIFENGSHTLRKYWQLEFPPNGEHLVMEPKEAAEEFIDRLSQATDAWRMSDIPVGSLLSGGIDSASIAILLSELAGNPIHTFNIGFEAASHNEDHLARETARRIGSNHHEMVFTSADFSYLPQVVSHLEEPQSAAPTLPLFLIYKACQDAGFKVVMSGQGSDELLGGYPWYTTDRKLRPYTLIPQPLRALLAKFPIHSSSETRHKFAHATRDPIQRFILLLEVSSVTELQPLLNFRPTIPLQDLWRDQYGQRCQGLHPFDQFVLLESETRLVNFINLYDDRLSMAHSVESRPAFLDHHLWEFCARLSPETKLSPEGNKYLLRLGMKDRLPADLVERPKKGLSAPYSGWWRAGELPNWVEEILHPSMLAQSGYFNVGNVTRLRQRHESKQANHIRELTSILTTQIWHFEVLHNL